MNAAGGPSVALYGAGMIATVHAMAAEALSHPIVAVASRTPARARQLAERIGVPAVDYAAIPQGREHIVVVSTPPYAHTEPTLHALASGSAVLVEKPLCTTLADADRLVAAEAATPGRLLYAENLAYAPLIERLLTEAAHLGPGTYIEARSLQARPQWGGFLTPEWGGGALFDLGAHPLALVVLLARPATVIQVSARLVMGTDYQTDEHADVELTFSDGGRGRVVASWQAGPGPVWDVQKASETGVIRAEIFPHPILEADGEPIPLGPTGPVRPEDFVTDYGYVGQLAALSETMEHGIRPLMDAEFGREILDITCAAYASARSGRPQAVPFTGSREMSPWAIWNESV